MNENLEILGNLETYLVFSKKIEIFDLIRKKLQDCQLLNILQNNWSEDYSKNIEWEESLFFENTDSEIVFEFDMKGCRLRVILTSNNIVVITANKPWVRLEDKIFLLLRGFVALTQLVLVGFELDFDYDNIEASTSSLKENISNYPFVLRAKNHPEEEFTSKEFVSQRELELIRDVVSRII